MTSEEKSKVDSLRSQGLGYKKIAQMIGVSDSAVKSYCRRVERPEQSETSVVLGVCLCCGQEVAQNPGRKVKKFCSDRCRMKWWNSHLDQVKRKANYEITCQNCGKAFISYGNAGRKYCCHDCYIEDRFGGMRR